MDLEDFCSEAMESCCRALPLKRSLLDATGETGCGDEGGGRETSEEAPAPDLVRDDRV